MLVVEEDKNRGEWKKGRMLRHVKGKDGIISGVVLLHKGHAIERPIQLVCPLDIKAGKRDQPNEEKRNANPTKNQRTRRTAAKVAEEKIRLLAVEEDK